MAQRLNISVPDFLYRKIERWRDSFNLSRIFQEAVEQAINKKEELQKRLAQDFDMQEAVERLKKEKIQSLAQETEKGEKDGLDWARRAHYQDLMFAISSESRNLAGKDSILHDYFLRTQNHLSIDYLNGWKKGVQDFWDLIEPQLKNV